MRVEYADGVDPMLWLTLVLALAAIASAVFAFVQAKAATDALKEAREARDESETARDLAVKLSAEANAAFVRQAEAQERANELAVAAMPKPKPHMTIQQVSKDGYVVHNDGDVLIRNVLVVGAGEQPGFIDPEENAPRDLEVGDNIGFLALKVMGPRPVVRVWFDGENGEREYLDRTIR